MKRIIGFAVCSMCAVALGGEWDIARAEWKAFSENYEPDYSDGSKYFLPPDGNRFDEPFAVVKDGKPAAKIVWRRDGWWSDALSTQVTKTAAEELRAIVKMLTGVELPLVGSLGEGPDLPVLGIGKGVFFPFDLKFMAPPLDKRFTSDIIKTVNADLRALRGTDGFSIRRFGRDLFVYGTCEKGAMNGVYKLIENNTDIIFSRPSESEGTVFTPLDGNLSFVWGDGAMEKPSMAMRGFWNYRHPRYYNANYLTTTPSPWTDERQYCRGGHNSMQFIPPAAERPDLHGLISGKRGDYGYMLCFSNPGLKAAYREGVLSHMDHREPSKMAGMHIYLDDTKNWCECEGCAKPLKLADGTVVAKDDPAFQCTQWFDLLNDSAAALDAAYPGMMVNTLAYFQTVVPPKCGVAENIEVGYCPYPRGDDLAPVYSESNLHLLESLVAWSAQVPRRRLWLRGYDGLGMEFPRPLSHTHKRDWKVYAKYVRGMEHEAGPSAGWDRLENCGKPSKAAAVFDYSAIEFWVMSRLMWNLDEDVEGLYKKFCYRAYREAAKPMERFYGTIRRAWLRRGLPSSIGEHGMNATKVYIIDGGLEDELRGHLEEAANSVRHPVAAGLVKRVRERFEHFIDAVKSAKTSSAVVPLQDRTAAPGFNDADWSGAAVIDHLYIPSEVDKGRDTEGRFPARIDLTQDGKTLYVRATLWEDMDKIVGSPCKAGEESVFGSTFECFFADNSVPGTYHLFRIDNHGNFCDVRNYDFSWTSKGVRHEVKRLADRWVVVLAVPFRELGLDIIANNSLAAAFMRIRDTFTPERGDGKYEEEYTGWKFNKFHKLSTFGTLTLQR